MFNSQEQKVVWQVRNKGEVSRNWALENYISRLGAIMFTLKNRGYAFKKEWRPTTKPDGKPGKDYVYVCIGKPEDLEPLF